MDHQQKHREHKEHEREEKKQEKKEHEQELAKDGLPFHPAWRVALGSVLVLLAVAMWAVFWR